MRIAAISTAARLMGARPMALPSPWRACARPPPIGSPRAPPCPPKLPPSPPHSPTPREPSPQPSVPPPFPPQQPLPPASPSPSPPPAARAGGFLPFDIHAGARGSGMVLEGWSGRWSVLNTHGGDTMALQGNQRAYLVEREAQWWNDLTYHRLYLRSKTLRWTMDISKVGCGCNAALYLVKAPQPDASGSRYCDILSGDSTSCLEIDLFEANIKSIAANWHTKRGATSDGTCNEWGALSNPRIRTLVCEDKITCAPSHSDPVPTVVLPSLHGSVPSEQAAGADGECVTTIVNTEVVRQTSTRASHLRWRHLLTEQGACRSPYPRRAARTFYGTCSVQEMAVQAFQTRQGEASSKHSTRAWYWWPVCGADGRWTGWMVAAARPIPCALFQTQASLYLIWPSSRGTACCHVVIARRRLLLGQARRRRRSRHC